MFPSSLRHAHTTSSRADGQRNSSELLDLDGVLQERQVSLKRSYSGYKGYLTRMYNEMESAMISSNVVAAMEGKKRIEETYGKFIDTYERLIQIIPMEQQEEYVRDQVYEVERQNKYLLSYQEWLFSINAASSEASSSPMFTSLPPHGFSKLSSLLDNQCKETTSATPSMNANIVSPAKGGRNN